MCADASSWSATPACAPLLPCMRFIALAHRMALMFHGMSEMRSAALSGGSPSIRSAASLDRRSAWAQRVKFFASPSDRHWRATYRSGRPSVRGSVAPNSSSAGANASVFRTWRATAAATSLWFTYSKRYRSRWRTGMPRARWSSAWGLLAAGDMPGKLLVVAHILAHPLQQQMSRDELRSAV
eukprot:2851247-Prymnesium_polylepis.1